MIGFIAGTAWLLALYLFTAWIAIGSLSSIQLRQDVKAEHNKSIDTLYLERIKTEIESSNQQEKIDRLEERLRSATQRRDAYIGEWQQRISQIEAKLALLAGQLGINKDQARQADFVPDSCKIHNISDEENNKIFPLCSERIEHLMSILNYDNQIGLYEDAVNEALKRVDLAKQELANLKADSRGGLENISTRWDFMTSWGYQSHLLMPDQILTLLLTLAMGALGSVVQMTWSFVKRDRRQTFRRYLLLPFVGSLSALIIFVFLKAGQITISAGGGSDPLDPFFLSFVGIISGLLSDRAYARMESLGRSFFGDTDEEQLRWGVRLNEALAAAGAAPADLGRYLDLPANEVDDLVHERASANPQQQRMLAAFLKRSVRELFTDLPPEVEPRPNGDERVTVPDLLGKGVEEAERDLAAAGLVPGARDGAPSDDRPAGRIVGQRPVAGETVAPGSTVDVTLSTGPAAPAAT